MPKNANLKNDVFSQWVITTGVALSIFCSLLNPQLAFAEGMGGKKGLEEVDLRVYNHGVPKNELTEEDVIAIDFKESRVRKTHYLSKSSLERELNIKNLITRASIKLLPSEKAMLSLAVRFTAIQKAEKTLDIAYFIFSKDIIGKAFLHEVCQALKRGVDVRILIDSFGSRTFLRINSGIKSLYSCKPGFIKDKDGNDTQIRAGFQAVIFNPLFNLPKKLQSALSKAWNLTLGKVTNLNFTPIRSWWNRRMHDKLIIIDGNSQENGMVITGGRNISKSYFDINKKAESTLESYQDLDVIIENDQEITQLQKESSPLQQQLTQKQENETAELTQKQENETAELTQISKTYLDYFNKLFDHIGNRKLHKFINAFPNSQLKKFKKHYNKILANNDFQNSLNESEELIAKDSQSIKIQFIHEIHNLFSRNVSKKYGANDLKNPNSIDKKLKLSIKNAKKRVIIVSPYIFFRKPAQHLQGQENKGHYNLNESQHRRKEVPNFNSEKINEFSEIQKLLIENPELNFEIITNSVITSGNILTQAVIDHEMIPELHRYQPQKDYEELTSKLLSEEQWNQVLASGRIKVWELGNFSALKGALDKGFKIRKLHSKFAIFDDDKSMITSSNYDYRSKDYNSESGIYIYDKKFNETLLKEAELLKSKSTQWGTPEWIELREKANELKGFKGFSNRHQKAIYKIIRYMPWLYWSL